ncbi:hypothetical protein Tco_0421973 [Tanacetum coccineum]
MQAARDRQKSYADLKRKPMEFQVGDKVMLKVSPWKGVLELPEELSRVHNYISASNYRSVMPTNPLRSVDGLHFDDIFSLYETYRDHNREVKRFKRSQTPLSSRFDGNSAGEVLSLRGNARINSGRNTHICSQRPGRRQVLRLKP